MSWTPELDEEIEAMFQSLAVPTFRGFQTFARTMRETRSERSAREEAEARAERQRTLRTNYDRARWCELRNAPLVAVEKDGVIWMTPPPELDRIRASSREYQRRKRSP